jgi:hypothetical protein
MDIAGKAMLFAQDARDLDELLHRIIFGADDPRRQEQPLDIIALVEIERQRDHLLRAETRALHIARRAVDAEAAVVDAEVGQQYLEQRNAPPVGGIAVTYAHPLG